MFKKNECCNQVGHCEKQLVVTNSGYVRNCECQNGTRGVEVNWVCATREFGKTVGVKKMSKNMWEIDGRTGLCFVSCLK